MAKGLTWAVNCARDIIQKHRVKRINRRFFKDILAVALADVKPITFSRPTSPLVTIIIPVFNKWQFTYHCLGSIQKNTSGVEYEIVVIDNASTDATPQLFERISGLTYVRNQTNANFAGGNNQGAKIARGKYLMFLNNDTEATPGWLNALVDELEHNSRAGIVGGRLLYPNNTIQHAGIVFGADKVPYHALAGAKRDDPRVTQRNTFPAVTGACLMISKTDFGALGGFDERYINGLEDVDLCLKMKDLGREIIYRPDCVAYHYESISSGRFKYAEQNTALFFSRWRDKIEPSK